jgi:hypothetical protein
MGTFILAPMPAANELEASVGNEPVLDYRTPEPGEPAPTQRTYAHLRCRGLTVIGGSDFVRLADPFSSVKATFCTRCAQMDALAAFAWVDTGEDLRSYRNRVRKAAPAALKIWEIIYITILVLFAFGGIVLGATTGFGRLAVVGGAMLGGGVAAVILWPIGRLLRVDFRRYR